MADVEYYGVPPSEVRNVESRYRYLAASGQTDFAANYEVGFVDVYKNGVKLDPVTDFTATDLVKITLSVGATLNDKIQIITRRQIPLANALAKSGDVATGTITLPSPILTGVPVAPTAVAGTATTQVATTAFVTANALAKSGDVATGTITLPSPILTGVPVAPTAVAGTATAQVATTAFVTAALQAAYPVGSVYTNASVATNPNSLLGFGTWTSFGSGKVLIGVDSTDSTFNAAGLTGGSKDAVVVAHTHSASLTGSAASGGAHSHSITDGGHSHSYGAGSTGTYDNGTGGTAGIQNNNGYTNSSTTGISIVSGGAHTHTVSVSGTTDSTGSSATNGNLQPYITVYMWLRTA